MPRKGRIDAPGSLHHITVRGIDRYNTFRGNIDKSNFRERLGEIVAETHTSCYAWAIMPNHAHMLLKTGDVPISHIMRRFLTGYALAYNHRHLRQGPVFLKRYQSILCQEDVYFLEMVRCIHLNPLRSGIVRDLDQLEVFEFSGHAALMGKANLNWQDIDSVLSCFGNIKSKARKLYMDFMEQGVASSGLRPDQADGEWVRNLGEWKRLRRKGGFGVTSKGDERILGNADFVQKVLAKSHEKLQKNVNHDPNGLDLKRLAENAAKAFGIRSDEIFSPGKYRKNVGARSVFCYWAVRKLGYTATELARRLGLTQPAVSVSVRRGEKIAKEMDLRVGKR